MVSKRGVLWKSKGVREKLPQARKIIDFTHVGLIWGFANAVLFALNENVQISYGCKEGNLEDMEVILTDTIRHCLIHNLKHHLRH